MQRKMLIALAGCVGILLIGFLSGCPCISIDECEEVTCEEGFVCVTGECILSDPCKDIVCDEDSICIDGECVIEEPDPCEDITCDDGLGCIDGECVTLDPCDGIGCDDHNACTTDLCTDGDCIFTEIVCDEGLDCINGECINPCTNIDCDDNANSKGCAKGCVCPNCDDGNACTIDKCDQETGDCTNQPIICAGGLDCIHGECINLCENVNCDDRDACTEDFCSSGKCIHEEIICESDSDKVETSLNYACINGQCVDICEIAYFTCPDGFICHLGECVEDLCTDGNFICPEGFHCNAITGRCDPNDQCIANGEDCAEGLACVDAVCTDLCDGIECGPGEFCNWETGDCVHRGKRPKDRP